MTTQPLTLTALADVLGISKGQASKLAARGMPTDDVTAARRWRAENLPQQWAKPAGGTADSGGAVLPPDADLESIRNLVPRNFAEAQYLTAVEDLLKRRLANAEEEGRLLDADEVRQSHFEMARLVRDAMLAIPARLQDALAACADPVECGRMLADEIRQALEAAADAAEHLGSEIDPAAGAEIDEGAL